MDAEAQPIQEHPNIWIPLPDGTRLAARLWCPEGAEQRPVPAILEYLPYRKRDGTADRDALTHPYLATRGYACVRVDMRGCGESDGRLEDEYSEQEQQDALNVIEWLCGQPWCDGNVGMMGISWGGFNALQVAAHQPRALKAIITLCSTDDRYADDIHYKGGCLLLENLGWASTMFAYQSRPADPALVGDGWRQQWLDRLAHLPSFLSQWLKHPTRDAYWRHGSVCEDWSKLELPVLAIGGWADAYHNPVARMMQHLPGPKQAIIGPWIHKYPHFAVPKPAMGFLQVAADWWDRWLKGDNARCAELGQYRHYLMDGVRPQAWYEARPGRWLSEPRWPSPKISSQQWHLGADGLHPQASANVAQRIDSPCDTGRASGEYCPIWLGPELPGDQREDDANALCFDTPVLEQDVAICGLPEVVLNLASDTPQANIAVRLCEVWPDGASTRITYGVLNLSHRLGHEHPQTMPVGQSVWVRVPLDNIGYKINAGNRLRLSLSNHYWPLIWPAQQRGGLTLNTHGCVLSLPIRSEYDDQLPALPPPESAPVRAVTELAPSEHIRRDQIDPATGERCFEIVDDFGRQRDDSHGLITREVLRERYWIHPEDPSRARAETHWTEELSREGQFAVRTETYTQFSADAEHFHIDYRIEAFEGDEAVWDKHWQHQIPRRFL